MESIIKAFSIYNGDTAIWAINSFAYVLDCLSSNKKQLKLWQQSHREKLYKMWMDRFNKKRGAYNVKCYCIKYGYTDAESFCNAIIDDFEYLQALPQLSTYINCIIPEKEKKLSKRQMRGKDLHDRGIIVSMSIETANTIILEEGERLLVIRNNKEREWTTPLVYIMNGPWDEIKIRDYRSVYAYETDSNYFEASPILYETCVEDPDRFYKTNPNEITEALNVA